MSEENNIPPEEITEEQPVKNDEVDETKSSAEPVTEPSTILNEPSTNMEVHAHTHPGHSKKTWKEYLWEFIMLFLAVFCGFLAEFQLEHSIEKQRANEFALSLKRDLIGDTTNFNTSINSLNVCINKIDSLIYFLGDSKQVIDHQPAIYRLSVYAFVFPISEANESTLQQLLNSGSLRYFKNDELVDTIKVYNQFVQSLNIFNESAAGFNIEFRKAQLKYVEINPILNFIEHNDFLNGAHDKTDNATEPFQNEKLLVTDGQALKEYASWCALKKFYMANSLNKISKVKKNAMTLLRILNKSLD